MSPLIRRTRMKYRNERERVNYSIFDIEFALKTLAMEGIIWTLQEMKDLTDTEHVLIKYLLNEFRQEQVYDNA
ncbi:hypothetical protein [Oceanobacillus picturae]|uniref:hypothetical protein n=1 Tax=Oceanobacillus picturae TaxID=171693 RepID=UPI0036292BAF